VRIAVSIWNGRIAPVFDVSRQLLVLEIERAEVIARTEEYLPEVDPGGRISRLRALRVEELICGAISRPLLEAAAATGIKVYPFIAGSEEEVINAYIDGNLPHPSLSMPGCRGQRRRFGGGRFCGQGLRSNGNSPWGEARNQERSQVMPKGDGTGPQGQGPGTGRGRGGCGKGSGQPAQPGQGRGTGRGAGQGAGKGSGKGRGQGRKGNQ
jgi:predicted Fe-Mo cluster-binding NifX family protein